MYMQVFQRLQKLNLCVSHQILTSIINTAGTNFDEKVCQWRSSLHGELQKVVEVSNFPVATFLCYNVIHTFLFYAIILFIL